jgi:esterase/lipase superfamily enzyme
MRRSNTICMRLILVWLSICSTLGWGATAADAQSGALAWEKIATVALAKGASTATAALPENTKRAFGVKLSLTQGVLNVRRVVVTYGNGQQHIEEKITRIEKNGETQPIDERDLLRGALVVESVALSFDEAAAAASIDVWALARPRAGSPVPRAPAAAKETGYKEIEVFYGTSRLREADRVKNGRILATFGAKDGAELIRGRALVTIPTDGRPLGEIPRPDVDLYLFRFNWRAEDPKKDFTLAAVDVVTAGDFASRISKRATAGKTFQRQAFVFIHGYNVGFEDAIFRAAQITHDIGFDGAPIVFSWQSRAGTLDYPHDQAAAGVAKALLVPLLREVANAAGVDRVNVIAHSMGNDVLLRALLETTAEERQSLKLGEVIFAAPDVDRASFERSALQLRGLARGGATLYASSSDRALQLSKRIVSGRPRAGDVPAGVGPVLVAGLETIDVSDAATDFFAVNHMGFAERRHLLKDIHTLFRNSVHPPSKRSEYLFTPIKQGADVYWRYIKN